MTEKTRESRLPAFAKIGYGVGTAGDSIPYTLFFSYFIFFMTDTAGVPAAIAGTISFIAVLWMGIAGPIIGYVSDNTTNPKGRRRPFLFKSVFPYAIAMALMFAPIPLTGTIQYAYFLILAIVFMTCYAAYKGPWDALGAELTQDYTERNNIRMWVGICAYPACLVASSGAIAIVGMFPSNPGTGWFAGAAMCSIVMLIACLICYYSTKGREVQPVGRNSGKFKFNVPELFKQYFGLLKVKGYRVLTIFQFVFVIGYTCLTNATVYMLTYNAGLNESQQALFWLANSLICLVELPIITAIANKLDKKVAVYIFIAAFALSCILFFVIGINGFVSAMIFGACVALGTSVFYGTFYSLIYDCCELHELVSGERREGTIMAMSQLAQTLGSALAGLVFGFMLTAIGYTGTGVESPETLRGILALTTVIPAIVTVVALVVLTRYKLTNAKYKNVLDAIEDKKAGKEVNLAEFKDII